MVFCEIGLQGLLFTLSNTGAMKTASGTRPAVSIWSTRPAAAEAWRRIENTMMIRVKLVSA